MTTKEAVLEDLLEKRLKKIEREIANLKNGEKYKSEQLQKSYLGRLRNRLTSERAIRKKEEQLYGLEEEKNEIEEQIAQYEELKQTGAVITDMQHMMMLPKAKINIIKQSFLYREKGRLNYLSNQVAKNDEKSTKNEKELNIIKKYLLKIYYDLQLKKLNRRIAYREKKIDEFKNFNSKNIFVLYGTSIIVQAREIKERISEKFSKNQPQPTK